MIIKKPGISHDRLMAARAIYTAIARQLIAGVDHQDTGYLLWAMLNLIDWNLDILDQLGDLHRQEWPQLAAHKDALAHLKDVRDSAAHMLAERKTGVPMPEGLSAAVYMDR